jgi:hypothetical protein
MNTRKTKPTSSNPNFLYNTTQHIHYSRLKVRFPPPVLFHFSFHLELYQNINESSNYPKKRRIPGKPALTLTSPCSFPNREQTTISTQLKLSSHEPKTLSLPSRFSEDRLTFNLYKSYPKPQIPQMYVSQPSAHPPPPAHPPQKPQKCAPHPQVNW